MIDFINSLKERVLLLDGALGTMIQKYSFKEEDFRGREFLHHPKALQGFNDILNITKPSAIKEIHKSYLEAGANIITTNTFNSNAISMSDYGLDKLEGLVERLNREGAQLAVSAVKEFEIENKKDIHFVGGSVGPTNRSLSMSPDITDPLLRNINFDELKNAYCQQIKGLVKGGCDILIFETFFDTLNLKAALSASAKVFRDLERTLPIIVSATVSDNAGRILSGQTLEAFIASVSHYDNVTVIGLNCGFGPDRMKRYIKEINTINQHFTSCHPNAGLPDEAGCYDVDPQQFTKAITPLLENSQLNIVGGCCGTTPAHIKSLHNVIQDYSPHIPLKGDKSLCLSGLDILKIDKEFIVVGERCNVAGSAKFLRLIKEGAFEEAAEIAKSQIRNGAKVIDINMDDAMLDAKTEMVNFVRYILAEPEIARVPFMIDSSKWEVIEAALKEIQGKGIVNSLSLKEGEEVFIERAKKVKDLGFALVVMAFDENGQADTYARKVEICKRSYEILVSRCGFLPEDIIFDVNVMTIATGMREHSRYAIDFIDTIKWIKENLPGTRTSGGISNLSFAFRGKNQIRDYMHEVFLHHAKKAGLDMAIINPSKKISYEAIPVNIRTTIEDIIFDRDDSAVERLIEFATEENFNQQKKIVNENKDLQEDIDSILINDLVQGDLIHLEDHIQKALIKTEDPVKIIEGPLLDGMKKVGDLFGEGKMFLPQVIKTARSMKRAVDILTPFIERNRVSEGGTQKNGKILIATVKGDVHDIGKNIVSTVLSCNNYEIIDLGIMVPAEKIVETALKEAPDIICLSGLITPSLSEMAETVKKLGDAGINIPVMVGGAATSLLHTALKINPLYQGTVLHMKDASQNPVVAGKILNPVEKESFLSSIEEKYKELMLKKEEEQDIISFNDILIKIKEEKRNCFSESYSNLPLSQTIDIEIPFLEVFPLINWKMFFLAWKIQGKWIDNFTDLTDRKKVDEFIESLNDNDKIKAREAKEIYTAAREIINSLTAEGYNPKAIIRFEKAIGNDKNIKIGDKNFPMLRQQRKGSDFLSLSDYIPEANGRIGFFAVTAGRDLHDRSKNYNESGDIFSSLLLHTLADRIVEACAEWLQKYTSEKYQQVSIRPAWGYPMLPDQLLIHSSKEFLSYERIEVELTENGAMYPPASISGLLIFNPEAKYFMVGKIGKDQAEDYSKRRGISLGKILKILRM